MYRILALDMDGTLLDSEKRVSPRTARALARLAEDGVRIVLATGRNVAEVSPYLGELPFIGYGVFVSGAVVYDLEHERAISSHALDADLARRVVREGIKNDAMVHVLTIGRSLARDDDIERMDELGMGVYRPLFEAICTRADDPLECAREHGDQVVKVNLYHPSRQARAATEAALAALPLALVHGDAGSLECTVDGISKGEGLRVLAGHLGHTLDETVMVGDSANDHEAFAAAGMAVAMGNADPQSLALAQLVVADCDHDGIAEAVERVFR